MLTETKNQTDIPFKKLRVGWFTFSCCEDNTVVMTEVMNDHWQEWKKCIDFRYAKALKSKNVLDEMDVAFIEGAIASEDQLNKLKKIRAESKILVAVGACAITGMPSGIRNQFSPETTQEIEYLLFRFSYLPKVLKVSDVVTVDFNIPGCPMEPKAFLKVINKALEDFKILS